MKKLNDIIVALTTNFDQTYNLVKAQDTLKTIIDNPHVSESVWTLPDQDASRDNFLNCIISGETHYGMAQLEKAFRNIEKKCGRTRSDDARGIAKMNIRILKYGEELLNTELSDNENIKKLLQEDLCLPNEIDENK